MKRKPGEITKEYEGAMGRWGGQRGDCWRALWLLEERHLGAKRKIGKEDARDRAWEVHIGEIIREKPMK